MLTLTVHPQRMLVSHLLCTLTKYSPFPEQIATESLQNTISEPSVERWNGQICWQFTRASRVVKADCRRYTHKVSPQGPTLSLTGPQTRRDSSQNLDTNRHLLFPWALLRLGLLMCIRQSINLINCELNICATFNSLWELLCISLFNYIVSLLPVMNNLPVKHKCFCQEHESKTGSKLSAAYQRGIKSNALPKHFNVIQRWKKRRLGTEMENCNGEETHREWERKCGVRGCDCNSNAAFESPHQDVQVQQCAYVSVHALPRLHHSCICRKILSVRSSVSPSVPG